MMTNTCIKFTQYNSTVAHNFNIGLSHKYVKIYVSFTVLVSTGWYDDDLHCVKFEQHPLSNSRDNSNVKYNFTSRNADADGDVDASVTNSSV